MTHEVLDEFCPECADWKPLIENTGWCLTCTRKVYPDFSICESCNRVFNGRGQARRVCQACDELSWNERNANLIENFMQAGLTYVIAVDYVRIYNRPLCLCCGKRIRNGTKGRHFFCRETAECRRAARSYKYHKYDKGLDKETAIGKVLESLK